MMQIKHIYEMHTVGLIVDTDEESNMYVSDVTRNVQR